MAPRNEWKCTTFSLKEMRKHIRTMQEQRELRAYYANGIVECWDEDMVTCFMISIRL